MANPARVALHSNPDDGRVSLPDATRNGGIAMDTTTLVGTIVVGVIAIALIVLAVVTVRQGKKVGEEIDEKSEEKIEEQNVLD